MSLTLKTSEGELKIELRTDLVPKPCFNFLALAASGYYDSTTFHRLIPGFLIQGGDPTGKGKGGESIWGEPFEDVFHESLRHDARGVVGKFFQRKTEAKNTLTQEKAWRLEARTRTDLSSTSRSDRRRIWTTCTR